MCAHVCVCACVCCVCVWLSYDPQSDLYSGPNGADGVAMQAYAPAQLPIKSTLAKEFGVFNKMYCSVPSASTPNHLMIQSATSCGLVDSESVAVLSCTRLYMADVVPCHINTHTHTHTRARAHTHTHIHTHTHTHTHTYRVDTFSTHTHTHTHTHAHTHTRARVLLPHLDRHSMERLRRPHSNVPPDDNLRFAFCQQRFIRSLPQLNLRHPREPRVRWHRPQRSRRGVHHLPSGRRNVRCRAVRCVAHVPCCLSTAVWSWFVW
jgi:hypothetical protein